MAAEDYWFPFNANKFMSDNRVILMDATEVGAYLMLMLHAWKDGTITSNDADLAIMSKAGDEWEKVKTRVLKMFDKCGEGYTHKSMNTLRKDSDKKRKQKSKAGKASGKARRSKDLYDEHPLNTR